MLVYSLTLGCILHIDNFSVTSFVVCQIFQYYLLPFVLLHHCFFFKLKLIDATMFILKGIVHSKMSEPFTHLHFFSF